MFPQGLLYAKNHKACRPVSQGQSASYFTAENTRLRYFYVDVRRDKEWSLLGGGCPYHDEGIFGRALQRCSLSNQQAARDCAASPFMTGDMLAWTDMRIEGGKCVAGARTGPPPRTEFVERNELKLLGRLFYNVPLPDVTPHQRALAREVMRVHQQGGDARCGLNAPPPPGSVGRAMLALLHSAKTPEQQHAFLMVFPGTIDPEWSYQDVCDFAQLEHWAWAGWDACLDIRGKEQWPCLTRMRVQHETMHIMAAYRDRNGGGYRVGDTVTYPMEVPIRTVDDWLACLRAETCLPAWLPKGWRVIMPAPDTHGGAH